MGMWICHPCALNYLLDVRAGVELIPKTFPYTLLLYFIPIFENISKQQQQWNVLWLYQLASLKPFQNIGRILFYRLAGRNEYVGYCSFITLIIYAALFKGLIALFISRMFSSKSVADPWTLKSSYSWFLPVQTRWKDNDQAW